MRLSEMTSEHLTAIGPREYPAETQFEAFVDRFVTVHKRDVAKMCERLKEAVSAMRTLFDKQMPKRGKARLEEVKYACEQAKKLVSQISMPMKRENGLCSTDPMIATGLNMVICAARGEGGAE